MDEPAIRLVRPIQMEYITMSKFFGVYGEKGIYTMTQKEFVNIFMRMSSGSVNPYRAKEIYKLMMDEAGLAKNFKCPIDFEGCTKFCGSYGCGG